MFISSLLPFMIGGAGLFLLFRLKFFFFLHPLKVTRAFFSEFRSANSRKALWLALAGTLGVGNIFGTAAGIIIGGAGCAFWLVLSSVFSGVLKFSETALTLELKEANRNGLQAVLPKIFKKNGRVLAAFYSTLCLLLSFLMGAAVQSSAVADICSFSLNIPNWLTSLILCLLILSGTLGGVKKIEKITSVLVPAASIVFVFLCIVCLFLNRGNIPTAVNLIFSEAISVKAFSGGLFGFCISKAVTEGFARGILSNEAGVGTSAMAHSTSDNRNSFVGGLFGMAEVFFDTVVLCGLTALALISSGVSYTQYSTPMSYVAQAFENTLGSFSILLLILSVIVFAYSTMICWYYYGTECVNQLLGKNHVSYKFVFFASVIFGTLIGAKSLLQITDTVIFLMALITLSALISSHNRIANITENFLKTKKRKQQRSSLFSK